MLARVTLAALLMGRAACGAMAAVPKDLVTTTTELGQLTGGLSIAISPDNSRLAFPANARDLSPADRETYDEKRGLAPVRLFVDGKSMAVTGELTAPLFSADSQHVGYAIHAKDFWRVMEDDRVLVGDAQDIPGYRGRGSPIMFSPDSKHVATIVQKNFRWHVAVDGKEWPGGGINLPECGLMSFSPDSQHLLVVGKGGRNTMVIYEDGAALPPPDPNTGGGKPLERIFPLYVWVPDSSCVGYYGSFPEKHWQVFTTDAVPFASKQYDGIMPGCPMFSGDAKRLAFVAKEKGKWSVVTDRDQSALTFDEVYAPSLLFLAPEKEGAADRLVYIAKRGAKWALYTDHQVVGEPFDGVVENTFVASADRKHFAFAVGRGNQAVMLRDGKEAGSYEAIGAGTPAFSADSAHLAYGVRAKMRWHVCVDGTVGTADFAGLSEGAISFSPDAKTVAFQAELNHGVMRLYVGINANYQSKFFDTFLRGSGVTWRDNASMVSIAVTKMIAYRVEAKVPNSE